MYLVSLEVDNRKKIVPQIQEILTKYGDNIESRIGLHNLGKERKGLILVVYNSASDIVEFVEELNTIEDINVNYMKI